MVTTVFMSVYQAPAAYAAQITNRTLTLIGVGTTGGSMPGGVVNHKFDFTLPTTGTGVGSIRFEYCTVAQLDACVAPTGMDASTAVYGPESGFTGFGVTSRTANSVVINRTTTGNPPATPVSFQLNSVKNTTDVNTTFFVRISTYASLDGSGSPIDTGSVAASTANQIQLSGIMPESLIFCTGQTITANNSVPDCSTATSGVIAFNQLFSPGDTATASSQMAASTNAGSGYVITVNGPTLTSGSNSIPAMAPLVTDAAIAPTRGTSQFGMNLATNTTATSAVPVGAAITPASDGVDLRAQAAANYATADRFKFTDGDAIAASNNGGAGPTNGQIYTVSYIVNVAGNLIAGTYSTTLTYICTATF